jgi:hypothetical protein
MISPPVLDQESIPDPCRSILKLRFRCVPPYWLTLCLDSHGVLKVPNKAVGCFGSFKTPCEYIPSLGKYGGAHRNLSLRIDLQGSGMLCKPKTGRLIVCSGRQDQLKNPLLSRRLGGGNVKIVMLVSTLQLGGCYS